MLSFRYHALSIVAVFLALAIGVVLGVAIGDSGVVSGAREDLEKSLRGDLKRARERNTDLRSEIDVRNAYEAATYPTLVRGMLRRKRIGIVAIGNLPGDTVSRVRAAVEPAGAELDSVNVIAAPLPTRDISSELRPSRLARLGRSERQLERFGRTVARQLANGGALPERVRHSLFSSSRGGFRSLDGIVVVRDRDGLEAREKQQMDGFEKAFFAGLRSSDSVIVGVEAENTDPSQIDFMKDRKISTVDDLNLVAGRTALAYVLAGAEGSYGTGEGDLIPERPSRGKR